MRNLYLTNEYQISLIINFQSLKKKFEELRSTFFFNSCEKNKLILKFYNFQDILASENLSIFLEK